MTLGIEIHFQTLILYKKKLWTKTQLFFTNLKVMLIAKSTLKFITDIRQDCLINLYP